MILYSGKAPSRRLGFELGAVALLEDSDPLLIDSYWKVEHHGEKTDGANELSIKSKWMGD